MSKNELLETLFQDYKERKIDPSEAWQVELASELDTFQTMLTNTEDAVSLNNQVDVICYLQERIAYRAGFDAAMALIKG